MLVGHAGRAGTRQAAAQARRDRGQRSRRQRLAEAGQAMAISPAPASATRWARPGSPRPETSLTTRAPDAGPPVPGPARVVSTDTGTVTLGRQHLHGTARRGSRRPRRGRCPGRSRRARPTSMRAAPASTMAWAAAWRAWGSRPDGARIEGFRTDVERPHHGGRVTIAQEHAAKVRAPLRDHARGLSGDAPAPLRRAREPLVLLRSKDAGDLLAVERLALQEGAGQRVELLDVLLQDLAGPRRRSRGRSA